MSDPNWVKVEVYKPSFDMLIKMVKDYEGETVERLPEYTQGGKAFSSGFLVCAREIVKCVKW